MLRALALVALIVPLAAFSSQASSVLHIKILVAGPGAETTPVARHALLISDNPATAAPWRVVTTLDGTVDVPLPPGSYIVESDQPARIQGRSYTWTELVVIEAGKTSTLDLTAGNAARADDTASSTGPIPRVDQPSQRLRQWQESVVAIWTSASKASGVIVDARGLVVTSQRAIGNEPAAQVQITSSLKVAARVLEVDLARGVAVLQIDPSVVDAIRPLPLQCAGPARPPLTDAQEIFAIDVALDEERTVTSGNIEGRGRLPLADLRLRFGSAGGPVFNADGEVVGITTTPDEKDSAAPGDARIVLVADVCRVVAAAEQRLSGATPSPTQLPVEPSRPFPREALEQAAGRPIVSSSYHVASSDFDIAFITPPAAFAAREQEHGQGREPRSARAPEAALRARLLTDFGRWSEYVDRFPPVLLVRATPRMAEGFWTTVARGAARTQGIALPPIKQFKPGFSRMRAFCGEAEVMPIHPFTLEWRVSESNAVREGLYVFDPGALGPSCGTVRLVLYSEKAPDRGDTWVIDPKIVQQVWQDFAPLRGAP